MKIAVYQGPIPFGDTEANLTATESALADAQAKGAEIVAMPETFLQGFVAPDQFKADYRATLHSSGNCGSAPCRLERSRSSITSWTGGLG